MNISEIQKNKFYERGLTLPKCINQGCDNDVAVRNWSNWSFKSECHTCQTNRKKGIVREGITIHKKEYCENVDGHLGFNCPVPTKESWGGFQIGCLDLDHIDGNHDNNSIENVRTYCKLCHSRKSIENGDCSNKRNSSRTFNE
jgi:hypothetical protein